MKGEVGLRIAEVTLPEERLALEVGFLDGIGIDDGQLPDAGTGQSWDDSTPNAASTDDRNSCFFKPSLPHSAHLRKDDVARVAIELVVGEVHRPVEPKPPAPRLVSPRVSTSRKATNRLLG